MENSMEETGSRGGGANKLLRQWNRLRNCGDLRGVIRKLDYKRRERKAMKQFGTDSFPDERRAAAERETVFPHMVKISILVPLWNNEREFQTAMLDSVLNQTYQNWELCLADGSDEAHSYIGDICREYAGRAGGRIVYRHLDMNGGIAANTNACLELASGEYIGLLDQDDILHPSVLFEYVKAINEQRADYLYCDETTFKGSNINHMLIVHFKPDYAPDNLRANNYICHFSVFKRTLLEGEAFFRPEYDGSQDHDMILRLTDRAEKVVHVPKVLYYWRNHAGSVASGIEAKPHAIDAARRAVAWNLEKHGLEHFEIESTRAFETIFRIRYEILGTPKISVVIINAGTSEELQRCRASVTEMSSYGNYEIIVGDEGLAAASYPGQMNLGAQRAEGDYLLFLDSRSEVITADWMEELLMYAQREDVGAVGAKLYHPDETICHAGFVLGLGTGHTVGNIFAGQHRRSLGYMGRLCYAQDISAVSGACLMVKRECFTEAGGFDESFAHSLYDADFCLRLREKGLLNIFTPFAELYIRGAEYGAEATDTNGKEQYAGEAARFRERCAEALAEGDPYYNLNFSLDRNDCSLKITQ